MKLIDADTKVDIEIYDDEYEEHSLLTMTIGEILDKYTDQGCPNSISIIRCDQCKFFEAERTEEFLPDGYGNYHWNFGCRRIREITGEWYDVYTDGFCDRGEYKGEADGTD